MTAAAVTPAPAAHPNGNHRGDVFAKVPSTMRAERRWVLWRAVERGGTPTKLPIQASGAAASSTDHKTWCTFAEALAAYATGKVDGIGFVLGDGWAGIDLDHHAPNGAPDDLAREIGAALDTYGELSPGGDGLHFITRGSLPGDDIGSNPLGIEAYSGGRYFTVTGRHLAGTPAEPQERTAELAGVYHETRRRLELLKNPFAPLVTTAASLADHTPPPADWLIENVIERGELALLTGAPGSMKSLFLLVLLVRVAAGVNALTRPDGSGGLAVRQTPVLWLNADNSERTHKARLVAALHTLGRFDVPFYSITTTDLELARPEHVRALQAVAADCRAGVLVVDTLSGVLPGVDENSASEMSTPAANLRALANSGLTVVALHHPPKNDINGSRGSSVLEAKVDRRYTLSRDGDLVVLKGVKTRDREKPPLTALAALESDPVSEALTGLVFFDGRGAAQDRAAEDAERRVLDALEGGPLNTRALYKAAKLGRTPVQTALATLILAKRVKATEGPNRQKIYELP